MLMITRKRKKIMESNQYPNMSKQKVMQFSREEEENYLNLWTYLKRRYPDSDMDSKGFFELVHMKTSLEGPKTLRSSACEIASVRKR